MARMGGRVRRSTCRGSRRALERAERIPENRRAMICARVKIGRTNAFIYGCLTFQIWESEPKRSHTQNRRRVGCGALGVSPKLSRSASETWGHCFCLHHALHRHTHKQAHHRPPTLSFSPTCSFACASLSFGLYSASNRARVHPILHFHPSVALLEAPLSRDLPSLARGKKNHRPTSRPVTGLLLIRVISRRILRRSCRIRFSYGLVCARQSYARLDLFAASNDLALQRSFRKDSLRPDS